MLLNASPKLKPAGVKRKKNNGEQISGNALSALCYTYLPFMKVELLILYYTAF